MPPVRQRLVLALAGSALLHAVWLWLPAGHTGQPSLSAPLPAALTVRLQARPATVLANGALEPGAPLPSAPPVSPPAPPLKPSLPARIAAFGLPLDDEPYYSAPELDRIAVPLDPISPAGPPGVTGRVVLELLIGASGRVDRVVILSADPPGVFEGLVQSAFGAARFDPAMRQGKLVRSRKRLEVCFDECQAASTAPVL